MQQLAPHQSFGQRLSGRRFIGRLEGALLTWWHLGFEDRQHHVLTSQSAFQQLQSPPRRRPAGRAVKWRGYSQVRDNSTTTVSP